MQASWWAGESRGKACGNKMGRPGRGAKIFHDILTSKPAGVSKNPRIILNAVRKGIDFIGVGVGAMIFNNEGKVFLAKRGKQARNEAGKWDFPGGGVEFGERCEQALKREIKEEFGIEIRVTELLEVVDHIIENEKQHWVSPSYLARHIGGTPVINEPEKCESIKWVDISEINPETLTITSRFDFEEYIQKYGCNPYIQES